MQPKQKGWKEGVLSVDLKSYGGGGHRKGQTVRYKVRRTIPDADGFKHTDFQYWVVNLDNMELVRTSSLKIDGVELVDYWKLADEKRRKKNGLVKRS